MNGVLAVFRVQFLHLHDKRDRNDRNPRDILRRILENSGLLGPQFARRKSNDMIEKGSADVIHLHPNDDVCVAVSDLDAGSTLHMDDRQITLAHAVPMGHKVAVNEIACGQPVHKYGQIIGSA